MPASEKLRTDQGTGHHTPTEPMFGELLGGVERPKMRVPPAAGSPMACASPPHRLDQAARGMAPLAASRYQGPMISPAGGTTRDGTARLVPYSPWPSWPFPSDPQQYAAPCSTGMVFPQASLAELPARAWSRGDGVPLDGRRAGGRPFRNEQGGTYTEGQHALYPNVARGHGATLAQRV